MQIIRKLSIFYLLSFVTVNSIAYQSHVVLKQLNVKTNDSKAHLTFNLSQKTLGKADFNPKEKRLTIQFKNTNKHFAFKPLTFKQGIIQTITFENHPPDLFCIITVKKNITYKIDFIVDKKTVWVKADITPVNSHFDFIKHRFLTTLEHMTKEANSYVEKGDALIEKRLHLKTGTSHKPVIKNKLIVVIDPGHGGKDSGAQGPLGHLEKNIVLAISKEVAKALNSHPNIHAILTRDQDYFVPLRKRMELARKGKADLFIAIHADAYFNNHANGASVYAVSRHGATSEAARWLAKRENYAELGNLSLNSLQDKSRELRSVLLDLAQTASIRDSLTLGTEILKFLKLIGNLHHLEVEQAPFMVLKAPDIPSILIETGFISNPREEKKLAEPYFQKLLANSISRGILQFAVDHLNT